MPEHSRDEPVYMIGVAAKLVESHPQTLRMYERIGLIAPKRTGTNLRLYSDNDIERLRQIQRLTEVGVNLAGVEMILDLLERMGRMREDMNQEIDRIRSQAEAELEEVRRRTDPR
jgi:MerR family transcriptional regulator, heat shock protein HspR